MKQFHAVSKNTLPHVETIYKVTNLKIESLVD